VDAQIINSFKNRLDDHWNDMGEMKTYAAGYSQQRELDVNSTFSNETLKFLNYQSKL